MSEQVQKYFLSFNQTGTIPLVKNYGVTTYHINDKIIMTNNNYTVGYYNGDIGYIVDIDEDGVEVRFNSNKTLYIKNSDLEDMQLAYAITIHKSQGAEYPTVIILISNKCGRLINRNTLYTAVTRAKKEVNIITIDDALEKAILTKAEERLSGLVEKINRFN